MLFPSYLLCLVIQSCWLFATLQPTRLLCPWDFPDNNTGMPCCHSLLQEIFTTQGSNPHLPGFPAFRVDSLLSELPGKPFLLQVSWQLKKNNFCIFIFVCSGSSVAACVGFFSCGVQASYCGGFSCWGAQVLGNIGFSSCGSGA